MKVLKLQTGQLQTNCYLIWNEKTLSSVIIDPADDADFITRRILDLKLLPKAIYLTHGHFDHVLATTELKVQFDIPIFLHKKDFFLVSRAKRTAEYFTNLKADIQFKPDYLLKENQILELGLRVIETPGHTPGSVCFYKKPYLFSGDTLFKKGVGRTDFSYGSQKDLEKSLKKLAKLPKDTIVFPGHGEETTIERELSYILQ